MSSGRHRAEHAGQPTRAASSAPAPSLRSSPTASASARPSRRALALGVALGGGQLGDPLSAGRSAADGALVALVEAELALVERTDLGSARVSNSACGLPARSCGLARRRRQPGDLLAGRGRPGCAARSTWPASLASPSRRSATARAAATCARSASARRALESCRVGDRPRSARPRRRSSSACSRCSSARTSSASASIARGRGRRRDLGSGSAARCRARSAASDAVPRNRSASADSRYQVSWRARAGGASAAIAASSSASRVAAPAERGLDLGAPGPDRFLVGRPRRRARRAGVTRSSASSRSRESRRSACTSGARRADLGLLAQRLELAAQLGGEVGEPGQVGLHRLELAQRLFLALAVLEHAGGFLDEAAAVLRAGLQHRVELALADDDVHLAADAGVGEQLLDVQQPARARR